MKGETRRGRQHSAHDNIPQRTASCAPSSSECAVASAAASFRPLAPRSASASAVLTAASDAVALASSSCAVFSEASTCGGG